VDAEVLEALDMTEVYNNLPKTYPDIKSEAREANPHIEVGAGCNFHLIKADIQDVFEFLVAVLTMQKKGCDTVTITRRSTRSNPTTSTKKVRWESCSTSSRRAATPP